jgi:GT2 family glycosyltransferase
MTRIAAVVVNYRTPAKTLRAVRSLEISHRTCDHIIIVENGSGDGSEIALRQAVPHATILVSSKNLGFAGGCNIGIREALARQAEFVLLLNSDAEVTPDMLGTLENELAACPDVGIVGPAVLTHSAPSVIESTGIRFSSVTGRIRLRRYGEVFDAAKIPDRELVPAVSGCVMLVRRQVFERIGLLGEEYFFGFEDIDFCLRACTAGYLTTVAGRAAAHHEGHGSIGRKSPALIAQSTRNHLLLLRQRAALPAPLSALRAALVVGLNVMYALFSAEVPRWAGVKAVADGVRAHLRSPRQF